MKLPHKIGPLRNPRSRMDRRRAHQVPFRWVWRTVHGREMLVKLYPPSGSRELLSVQEQKVYAR